MNSSSCSKVDLRNTGAVSRMKSFQNWPGSSSCSGAGAEPHQPLLEPLRLERPRERLLDHEHDPVPSPPQHVADADAVVGRAEGALGEEDEGLGRSRSQPRRLPASPAPGVEEAVVHATLPPLPELDGLGLERVAAPVLGPRHLGAIEPRLGLAVEALQLVALDRPALGRDRGRDLAVARTARRSRRRTPPRGGAGRLRGRAPGGPARASRRPGRRPGAPRSSSPLALS